MREETRVCKECGAEKSLEKGFRSVGRGYKLKTCKACEVRDAYYECVSDPSLLYVPGCKIKGVEFKEYLGDGYVPPASVWRSTRNSIKYRVVGNEHYHDICDVVREPNNEYLEWVKEKQRLVRI